MRMLLSLVIFLMLPVLLGVQCAPIDYTVVSLNQLQEGRRDTGVPPLEWDARLAAAAAARAEELATWDSIDAVYQHAGFWDDKDRWAKDRWVCELLGSQLSSIPADAPFIEWRSSSTHWACAVDPFYTKVGIGSYMSDAGRIYQAIWLSTEPPAE